MKNKILANFKNINSFAIKNSTIFTLICEKFNLILRMYHVCYQKLWESQNHWISWDQQHHAQKGTSFY